MGEADIDSITEKLQQTLLPPSNGVSFAGKSLKLDGAKDAKEVVSAIKSCEDLVFLNLEGNSVGVEAAAEIGKALSIKPEFKQAIWKDMFTGRMKTEIPKALELLGKGVIEAKAQLEILDLSDNASGPIGVEGFSNLLRSPSCYTLKELRLNNMGLGITGAKMLAAALSDCCMKSKTAGTPLALKVFVAGRNRLENEGVTVLAQVFKEIGTLEEVWIPQNGINAPGFRSLANGLLQHNPELSSLNLNDNTVAEEGAKALALVLPCLTKLRNLDLGDCLLRSEGAQKLSEAFTKAPFSQLEEVNLTFNEINKEVGVKLAEVLARKPSIKSIQMNGNEFGIEGREKVKEAVAKHNKMNVLGTMSGDSDVEDEEDEEYEEEESEDEEQLSEEEESEENSDSHEENGYHTGISPLNRPLTIHQTITRTTGADFLHEPTTEKFKSLGGNKSEEILKELKLKPGKSRLVELIEAIMEVSSLCKPEIFKQSNSPLFKDFSKGGIADCSKEALECTETMYKTLFNWAQESNDMSSVNNSLPIYLGLIKNEDKSNMTKKFNIEGCLLAVDNAVKKGLVPGETLSILTILRKNLSVPINIH